MASNPSARIYLPLIGAGFKIWTELFHLLCGKAAICCNGKLVTWLAGGLWGEKQWDFETLWLSLKEIRWGMGWGMGMGGGLVSPEFILLIDYQPMGPLVKVGRGESLFLKKLFPLISHVAVFYLNCINSRHIFLCCNLSSLWNRLPNLDQTTPSFVWNSHSSLSWR